MSKPVCTGPRLRMRECCQKERRPTEKMRTRRRPRRNAVRRIRQRGERHCWDKIPATTQSWWLTSKKISGKSLGTMKYNASFFCITFIIIINHGRQVYSCFWSIRLLTTFMTRSGWGAAPWLDTTWYAFSPAVRLVIVIAEPTASSRVQWQWPVMSRYNNNLGQACIRRIQCLCRPMVTGSGPGQVWVLHWTDCYSDQGRARVTSGRLHMSVQWSLVITWQSLNNNNHCC